MKVDRITHSWDMVIRNFPTGGRPPLGFGPTGSRSVRSAVLENPTIEPNMKWIGWPVAEIWPFEMKFSVGRRSSIQGGPKIGTIKLASILYALTSSNIDRFSKFFHCQNQEKICNKRITKDPTTPQLCRYTTLWNVNVLKATTETRRLQ